MYALPGVRDTGLRGPEYAVRYEADAGTSVPGTILLARSYDAGATWSEPVSMLTGASRPTIAESDGTIIVAGLVGNNIVARRRGPGDADFAAQYTFATASGAIEVEDDSFHLGAAHELSARWVLHAKKLGASDTTVWWSADNGTTWTEV